MSRLPDELDLKIIDQLRDDGRLSNKALAEDLGVSEATIAARLRSLSEDRTMHVTAQSDMYALGYEFMCFVDVYVSGRNVSEVAGELAQIEAIHSVSASLGSPELLLMCYATDRHALLQLLHESIASVRGVEHIETSIALDVVKYRADFAALSPR